MIEKVELQFPNGSKTYVDTINEAKDICKTFMEGYAKEQKLERIDVQIAFDADDSECILLHDMQVFDTVSITSLLLSEEQWLLIQNGVTGI